MSVEVCLYLKPGALGVASAPLEAYAAPDDTAWLQALINKGGRVYLHGGSTYRIGTVITLGPGTVLSGPIASGTGPSVIEWVG